MSERMVPMTTAGTSAGRRPRTPSADVQRELIAAAEAVLERDGPGALTVRAVAAQAGIAPMGVYNRLGGKDGLPDSFPALRSPLTRWATCSGEASEGK